MRIRKLETVNAFVAIDLDGVPGQGIVRLAPRILQSGARDLARSVTYALACLERQETGISAGISVPPEDRDIAVAAFITEIEHWDDSFSLSAGKGVTNEDLNLEANPNRNRLLAVGTVAAGLAAAPKASTAMIEGSGADGALVEELAAQGIEVVSSAEPFDTVADLLFCGSKMGVIDHEIVNRLAVATLVPTGPLPITTRAIAHCRQRNITALPDFVTTAGPLVGDVEQTRQLITTIITEATNHDEGPIIGACVRAEEFLNSWQDDLPFGRPMAP